MRRPGKPEKLPPITFNWRDSSHWSRNARACVRCGTLTNLLDYDKRPSHKVCAELEANPSTEQPTRSHTR